jgi:glutamate synthase domain-containing protein 1
MVAHNGEINTVRGNRFWMAAREALFASPEFGDEIKDNLPVIEPGKSDSAASTTPWSSWSCRAGVCPTHS